MRDDDGKVYTYGEYRLKQINEECYIVSKNLNTSVIECLSLPVKDLNQFIRFIAEDARKQRDELEKIKTEKPENRR